MIFAFPTPAGINPDAINPTPHQSRRINPESASTP
jgi:hypothetical protein